MSKPAAIFVAAAMAVTAGCVVLIAGQGLGLSAAGALLAGFAALVGMAITHLAFLRGAPAADGRLDEVDAVLRDLQERLEEFEVRLSTVDGASAERARAATRPLVEEIAALGGLVTTVAKEVAAHDVALAKLAAEAGRAAGPAAVANAPAAPVKPPAAPVEPPPAAQPAAGATADATRTPAVVHEPRPTAARIPPPEPFDPDAVGSARAEPATGARAARIDRALREDRIEAHMQPIVGLPGRRVAHYEAFCRLVETDGLLPAADVVAEAVAEGRVAELDLGMIERCALVALRLAARGVTGVFCNLSPKTIGDPAGLGAIAALFERQPELRPVILLETTQAGFAALGGTARAGLEALAASGVRLSIDGAEDLRLDPRELARAGVRFVKVPAARLLDADAVRGATIHPADLASLLSRHGVELVATHVEEERVVPELLDMKVRYAQGHLFGVARPARPAGAKVPEPSAPPARLVPRTVASR
jgi:cyclic-di-GMP phosphodiesterase, flagellum assembly factor TipF